MVTAEQKAEELVNKFYATDHSHTGCIYAALICVDEILSISTFQSSQNYWKEVKKEIEKL